MTFDSPPAIETTAAIPSITSAPPTKAADVIAAGVRVTRRSPSSTADSQISSGVGCGPGTAPGYPAHVSAEPALEAQHGGDRSHRLEPLVVAQAHDLGRLHDRAPHGQVGDVVTTGGLGAVGGTGADATWSQPAALRTADAGGVEVVLQQEHLDTLFVERSQRVFEAGRAATARATCLLESVERLLLQLALVGRDCLLGRMLDVVDAGVLDVDVDPARHALREIRMKTLAEVLVDRFGRSDEQRLERAPLVTPKQLVDRVLQVVLRLLVDRALVARLRPTALVVTPMDLVVDACHLVEAVAGAPEDAGGLAVDKNHAITRT